MKGFTTVKNLMKRDVRIKGDYIYKNTDSELFISNSDWLFNVSHLTAPNRAILHAECLQSVTSSREKDDLENILTDRSSNADTEYFDSKIRFTETPTRRTKPEASALLVPSQDHFEEGAKRVIVVRERVLEIAIRLGGDEPVTFWSSSSEVLGAIQVRVAGDVIGVFMPIASRPGEGSGDYMCLSPDTRRLFENVLSVFS